MKNIREYTLPRFERDTKNHKMEILRDDGLYRHLRFRQPSTSSYWFDIVTWPGNLTINGDMGCYVFARLEDMFEFFRTDRKYGLGINPGYWQEKIRNNGSRKAAEKFQPSKFREVIHEQVKHWLQDEERLSREDYAELWQEIKWDIFDKLDEYGDDNGHVAFTAANDFSWKSEDGRKFEFRDLWDHRYNDYTFEYIWNCFAIAYAVQAYDDAKMLEAA